MKRFFWPLLSIALLTAAGWVSLLTRSAEAHDPGECVCPTPPPCTVNPEVQQAVDQARAEMKALSAP
jgi:hypothetical protein